MQIFTPLYHWDEHQWMHNSQIFHVGFFFPQKQQQHKTYNSNKNFVYELKFISGHLVIRRLHFTPECRIGDPEQRRTEHSRAMLDHTGSQAVLLYSTPSTPWLQLLCPVSCVHTFMCMCVCTYPPARWPQLSLPLCRSPGQGWPLSWSHFKETRDGL